MDSQATNVSDELVKRLRELLAEATTPNPFDWYFPWRVQPDGGKPTIVGARSGNLFRGFIGTWQEARLVVETVNALPDLLDIAERTLSPPRPSLDVERLRDALERIEAMGFVNEGHGCALIARDALSATPVDAPSPPA